MRTTFATALAAALFASTTLADPFAGYYYPASVQVGSTNRIVVGGQRLGAIKGGWITGKGVEIVRVEKTRSFPVVNGYGQQRWIEKWMYAILDGHRLRPPFGVEERHLLSWNRHPWWENLDKIQPLEFSMVAHYLNTPRNPLQMSPSLSERLIVTVVAARDAPEGLREIFLYDDRGMTAPHPFFVSRLPHGAEPLYSPPLRTNDKPPVPPRWSLPVILNGQILPGQADAFQLTLRKGSFCCRLVGRELQPYLGDAVPGFFNPVLQLVDSTGRKLAFADDFHYLPDPVLRCEIPADGLYTLEVRDNLYRGREDFVYILDCRMNAPPPAPQDRAFVGFPNSVEISASDRRGVLAKPGQTDSHDFCVRTQGPWRVELFARRRGSPLDGVVRLYGPLNGKKNPPLLATWDDVTNTLFVGSVPQAECDPIGEWTFASTGTYRVVVSDRVGAGGKDYGYALRIAPSEPSFDAYAQKSSFVLHRYDRVKARFKVKVVRHGGFTGTVRIADTADFLFRPNAIPAGTNEAEIACVPVRRDWEGLKLCAFKAQGEVGRGRFVERPLVPADEAEQAFAYTHLLPARAFAFTLLEIYGKRPRRPDWTDMPYDEFMPRKVLRRHLERTDTPTNAVAALNALAETEVPVAAPPVDFGVSFFAVRVAASAAALRGRREVVAVEPQGGDDERYAVRAALAGVTRFVGPDFTYADGDLPRVRALSKTDELPRDNDLLFYLPNDGRDPLSGSTGLAIRQLTEEGWCFDFVTDQTLERAGLGRKYRAVYVPPLVQPIPEKIAAMLQKVETNGTCVIVRADGSEERRTNRLSKKARRERLPEGVRFARFGNAWGEGLYLVHNAGSETVKGPWRFNMRGKGRHAVAMEIGTGKIFELAQGKRDDFLFTLKPGESAWLYVTYHDFEP